MTLRHLAIATAATFTLAISLAACGGATRSPEAYCRAFYETATPIREHYVEVDEEVEEDPLSALATLLSTPGDLTVIFDRMAEHAPDEIKADTEEARDALKKQQESLGEAISDPLGAIGSGVIAGLTSSGSFSRVNDYLQEHCPVDSELAQEVIDESR